MLGLSLLFIHWIVSLSGMPLPTGKMALVLMLLIFGGGIGSVHLLTLGCLIRSYSHFPLSRCYKIHEEEKKRAYDERIWEVERACFSPLIFAATGGMGPSATTVFRKSLLLYAG